MAVFKFSNVGGFGTYQRYNDFLAGNPVVNLDKGSMFPLGVFTLSSSQANVEFTNIPQTYTHLQIRAIARGTTTVDTRVGLNVQVNSDTGSNYSVHNLHGDGATAEANGYASQTKTFGANFELPQADALSNVFGAMIVDVFEYKNTSKYKTMRALVGFDNNGTTGATGRIVFESGLWMNTNAITSIKLYPSSDSWAANSSFALYGVQA